VAGITLLVAILTALLATGALLGAGLALAVVVLRVLLAAGVLPTLTLSTLIPALILAAALILVRHKRPSRMISTARS
jgi:lipopolysaccharide export LptBFGC system permease protein LptF